MSLTSQTLMEMYDALKARFGHQGWWPGDGSLEICVGAVLTQNTNWRNVERAIANLKDASLTSVSALNAVAPEQLAELIRPAGYFRVKAKRLKNFIAHVFESYGDDIEGFLDRSVSTLREELLSIRGIGPETADSIILYAAGKCTFVVDTYTCRVLMRHKLIAPEDGYEQVKELMESSLPEDVELWNDFHAQFVVVGKHYCKPRPKCDDCPLEPFDHDVEAALEGW
ncbi:MAG: endonuclease III domain-containing protein [Phycisphaerae bacterium]